MRWGGELKSSVVIPWLVFSSLRVGVRLCLCRCVLQRSVVLVCNEPVLQCGEL